MLTAPKVVSLFCGAGGLDLGFKRAGFNLVWANDFDESAVRTYRENLGENCVLGDISKISERDIPECDVVIGGFPCQGFSLANTKRNVLDERNSLYLQYIRVLKAKKPKFFLAENVKGILSLGCGRVIEAILEDFAQAGYQVKYKLLNAADYGVPQTRQRVVIVGVRNDLEVDYEFPKPGYSKKSQEGLKPWISVKDAISGIPDPDGPLAGTVPNNEYSQYHIKPRNYTGHRVTDPDKPSPTILARGNGGGGVVAIPHYNGMRRMTVRESATIQTFPLNFKFYGTRGACYRQIGNAVPVLLAEQLAGQMMLCFESI